MAKTTDGYDGGNFFWIWAALFASVGVSVFLHTQHASTKIHSGAVSKETYRELKDSISENFDDQEREASRLRQDVNDIRRMMIDILRNQGKLKKGVGPNASAERVDR